MLNLSNRGQDQSVANKEDVDKKTSIDLGITGASVGDIIKVKAVDGDGKPTEWEAISKPIVSLSAPTDLTLVDNTEYYITDVSNLTITYPDAEHWEVWISLATADSGTVTVTLPTSSYIGTVPTFAAGEVWEISIRDGVVVAGKTEDLS